MKLTGEGDDEISEWDRWMIWYGGKSMSPPEEEDDETDH